MLRVVGRRASSLHYGLGLNHTGCLSLVTRKIQISKKELSFMRLSSLAREMA